MRTVWNRLSNQGAYVHHVPASESDVRHGDLASRFHDPVRLAFFAISHLPQTSAGSVNRFPRRKGSRDL